MNKKALSAVFADSETPKVIGVLPVESEQLDTFKAKMIAAKEANPDLHVRTFL
jgi:hypothetical protein